MRATYAPYQLFAQAWHYVLLLVLVSVPIYLAYQTMKVVQFQSEGPGTTCSYIGILYFVLIPFECYLLLIFSWLQMLRRRILDRPWHFLQLFLIFLVGVVPGVVLLFLLLMK